MLTKADDFPIHQTPEPIAYSGTDRNFYDRYWFNGYEPDGSLFFLAGMGVYPHLNIIDCGISIQVDGVQHCLRGSKILEDRMDTSVGPIRIEIVEPLQKLRIVVEEHDGIAADITITGRAFPIEEPRFMRRVGTKGFLDYTRLTQNGHWTGWVSIDGRRIELSDKCTGTRDRSWGTRPIGMSDPQPNPLAGEQGYFWQWTPLNFKDKSFFYHIAAEPSGHIWNTRSVLCPDGTSPESFLETENAVMETELVPGTLWPESGKLTVDYGDGPYVLEFEPFHRMQMKGIGYFHSEWFHGNYHGPYRVEREDFNVADLDPMKLENLHVQRLSRVKMTSPDGTVEETVGTFEQAILGAYEPLGITSGMDITRWDKD
ncbi:hypothetical protein [Croceicoccus bisphenolivorans]|uniref:hypothetical protein n=1 Tax=Croceicoccus bisphenolivorans TaxID=1783232 RepID=UPI000837044A|nr:hypothetical protein [Croceicoccus bisphenolivorans]